jgi:hypothetical protein
MTGQHEQNHEHDHQDDQTTAPGHDSAAHRMGETSTSMNDTDHSDPTADPADTSAVGSTDTTLIGSTDTTLIGSTDTTLIGSTDTRDIDSTGTDTTAIDATVDPTPSADTTDTTTTESTPTESIPSEPAAPVLSTPFVVEPDQPVPDDVVRPDTDDTGALPQVGAPASASWPPPTPVAAPVAQYARPPLVTVRKGPRPGTIMLGLLSLIVAAWVLATNLTGADVDLRVFGPAAFGALGGVLLLVGLVGLLAGVRRR